MSSAFCRIWHITRTTFTQDISTIRKTIVSRIVEGLKRTISC